MLMTTVAIVIADFGGRDLDRGKQCVSDEWDYWEWAI